MGRGESGGKGLISVLCRRELRCLADLVHRKGLDVQLYPFGTGEIKTWLTTAKATYKTTKGDDEGQPIHVPLCARDP